MQLAVLRPGLCPPWLRVGGAATRPPWQGQSSQQLLCVLLSRVHLILTQKWGPWRAGWRLPLGCICSWLAHVGGSSMLGLGEAMSSGREVDVLLGEAMSSGCGHVTR